MAKSKKSRRARRQAKQKQAVVSPIIKDEVEPVVEEPKSPEVIEVVKETPTPRNLVNFAQEYFYVYTELRNILIVAIIMFIVMTGLAYFV